nr:DNA translocase FtsK [Marinobacter sp. LV10R510-11A]
MNQDHEETRADPLYSATVAFVAEEQRISISQIQRHHKIGYNRAANLVDAMEEAGVVTKAGHNGARGVLITESGKMPEIAEAKDTKKAEVPEKLYNDELCWRMEKVVQFAAAAGFTLSEAACELNKALQLLKDGTTQSPGS